MDTVIISASRTELTQSMFNKGAALYIIKGNFEVKSKIVLPKGSELRIDEGSIRFGEKNNGANNDNETPNGIYLLCNNQETIDNRPYKTLCLTSFGIKSGVIEINKPSDTDNPIKHVLTYTQTLTEFLKDGDYIKNIESDNFEMRLTANCRLMMPTSTEKYVAYLRVVSNKVNTIQIDGKSNFSLTAENCKIERIFANKDGFVLCNRLPGTAEMSRFINCDIFAEDFAIDNKKLEPYDSNFLSIWATFELRIMNNKDIPFEEQPESFNTLTLRGCTVKNIGLTGSVNVNNCKFYFGKNLVDNYETIHASNHSRITNCIFDGQADVIKDLVLKADVIDLFNGHNIIISGCAFVNYNEGEAPGSTMITVKSHYHAISGDNDNQNVLSDTVGPQNGAIIRNCCFDLPKFTGNAIEVWNEAIDSFKQVRSLNRHFTVIENNYINMPLARSFVYCLRYTDFMIVRNNFGCVNDSLVFIPANAKTIKITREDANNPEDIKNKVHNFVVEGNILRDQLHSPGSIPENMCILKGAKIENLVLNNNSNEGKVWSLYPGNEELILWGVVRFDNNQAIGSEIFGSRYPINAVMPENVLTFCSGNVSKGRNTDLCQILPQVPSQQGTGNSNPKDEDAYKEYLLYNGLTLFDTQNQKQYIYLNGQWFFNTFTKESKK